MSSESSDDVEPLDLILWMTKVPGKDRPTAQQVVNTILSFESQLPFYGHCCCRDDDTTRSSQAWSTVGLETPEKEEMDPILAITQAPLSEDNTPKSGTASEENTISLVSIPEENSTGEVPQEPFDHLAPSQPVPLVEENQHSRIKLARDTLTLSSNASCTNTAGGRPSNSPLAKRDR